MSVRDLIILGSSSQQPTRKRNHGAYLLRWNEEGMLFDPGEGTQRQFIYANVSPTCVSRIFISHFHGDHCLGLGSFLMRLNLDRVGHPIKCYYPASGKKYFDRLRFGTPYHNTINVVEYPVHEPGMVEDDGNFKIEATFVDHGIDCVAWRITEPDQRKFDPKKLSASGVRGPFVKELERAGSLNIDGNTVQLDDVSWIRQGESIAVIMDTRPCPQAVDIAKDARLILSEATYLDEHRDLAFNHNHMTVKQAAQIAKDASAKELVLTHFSARYLDLSPFKEQAQEIFPNVHIAKDMKVIEIPRNT